MNWMKAPRKVKELTMSEPKGLKQSFRGADVEVKLREELERLKRIIGMGYELKVVWMPNAKYDLSGEVKDNTIYIYEAEEDKALQVLRHELIDYLLTSKIAEPYVKLVNVLVKLIEDIIYRDKERLVESLCKLLSDFSYNDSSTR